MLISVLFCLIIGNIWCQSILYGFIFTLLFFIFTKKKIVIPLILISLIYSNYLLQHNSLLKEAKVVESYDYGCILKNKGQYYMMYTDACYSLGTMIQGDFYQEEVSSSTNFNAFDYKDYLRSKKVFCVVGCNNINVVLKKSIKQKIIDYIDRFQEPVSSYTKQLLLGIKDEYSQNLYQLTSSLSLLHLFAISGMHLTIIEKWFKKVKLNEHIIFILLGIYVVIVGNVVSLWRAYLFKVFKKYLHLDSLDALALTGIILLLYNPFFILGSSFCFSMVLSFFIEITKKVRYKEFLPYIASIPLILFYSYELPLLGIFYTYICSGLVETIFTLIFVNFLLLGKLSWIVNKVILVFENCLVFLNDYNYTLIFGKIPIILMILYYYLLLKWIISLQFRRKKNRWILGIVVILVSVYFYPYYNPIGEVTMIDVGQGDCILVRYPFDQGNVLIDTGGSLYTDIAVKRIIPYLKSIGIKSLDYVILTHDDYDHSGAYESLKEHFKIKQKIQEGKDFLDFKYIDLGYQSEENARSLVYILDFYGKDYLFTGDLPLELEKDVCDYVDSIDILKVGHHGSNTSTSAYLLEHLSPDIALIGVGKNNSYGHPNIEVIDRLNAYHVKVYRTDQDGMIRIRNIGSKSWIETKNSS